MSKKYLIHDKPFKALFINHWERIGKAKSSVAQVKTYESQNI